ncbi:hypothetical protein JYU34_017220 [Plutella xylostella]|uniref:Uncharacterized protein n=1 Tax=Plutella xylostella TaxID=51655 RepID=A0ABQ7Q226_PLUXY|nr:hypothetical protein JYU34_017220 [Plutella xylostella]
MPTAIRQPYYQHEGILYRGYLKPAGLDRWSEPGAGGCAGGREGRGRRAGRGLTRAAHSAECRPPPPPPRPRPRFPLRAPPRRRDCALTTANQAPLSTIYI